jgi:gamma-glutamyl-gamma-aminobutyrate hydrolase PuuD
MTKPLIGITTERWSSSPTRHNARVQGVLGTYVDALLAAGGLPVLIPISVQGEDLHDLYSRLQGVILPGGGDVSPDYYHAPAHPATHEVDTERDLAELWLARQALTDGKPLFGICRGLQVLNVASGGSLVQDLPSELPQTGPHYFRYPEYPLDYAAHSIQIEEDSLLAACFDSPIVAVNSRHHQAMREVGPGLQVVGRSPDGVIEAVQATAAPFVLGVQWHPENMQSQAGMRALFERFVAAATTAASQS